MTSKRNKRIARYHKKLEDNHRRLFPVKGDSGCASSHRMAADLIRGSKKKLKIPKSRLEV